jgi:uncharacterized protein
MDLYPPVHANDLEDQSSNPSSNPHFSDLLDVVAARRGFLKAGVGAAALGFIGVTGSRDAQAQYSGSGPSLGFASVPLQGGDVVTVPPGHQLQVLYAWGDPIGKAGLAAGAPAWSGDASETAAEQELQSGAHHDGMHFFPFPARGSGATAGFSNTRGLLCINHEYVDQGLLWNDGMANWSLAKVRKSQAAHGVSVIEVRKAASGAWEVVRPSAYARRLTVNTPMRISGPATALLGTEALGTLNNCANGYTPWGTYLTCEENWNGYFGARAVAADGTPGTATNFTFDENERRYGLSPGGFGYNWFYYDDRFDLNGPGRSEQYKFGWVVEVDPFNPASLPVKRTALGRIKHEGAVYALTKDGRVVIYTGDDQANDYIYKFISAGKFDPRNRAADLNLLDSGTLYVARFDAGSTTGDGRGSGVWLPLTLDNPAIAAKFSSLAAMLLGTRLAADLAGATRMDRPEWISVDPRVAGRIYCTLTNNSGRAVAAIDEANPRSTNRYGHIIRWDEAGADPAATTFDWDIFVLAGDRDLAANAGTPDVGNINGDTFGSPDGLWHDPSGRLWIQTDISSNALGVGTGRGGYANITNNMMLAANPVTGEIRRFLTGPKGCEVTGITMTPDSKTMFVNFQHPGEGAGDNSNPADPDYPIKVSAWPGNQGYGFQNDGVTPRAKLRPRSGTVVITRTDGGVLGE